MIPYPHLRQSAKSADPFSTQITLSPNITIHQAFTQPLATADHQKIVSNWNKTSFQRGQKIYQKLCITCHGDKTKEGSNKPVYKITIHMNKRPTYIAKETYVHSKRDLCYV